MIRKIIFISISVIVLFYSSILAYGNDKNSVKSTIKGVPSEFQLKEEDFTYNRYKETLININKVLDSYYNNKIDKKRDWEIENILIPNSRLKLQGYGLFTQRNLLRLKLENAKLKKEKTANLEKELKDTEKQISIFLKENLWND